MSPAENETRLREEFEFIPDVFEQLNHLIERSHRRAPLGAGERIDAFKVTGCPSNTWIVPDQNSDDGLWTFRSQSDAPISGAIAALFCDIFSGCTIDAIARHQPTILDDLGLTAQLTENRLAGARRMIEQFHQYAATQHPCESTPQP